MTQLDISLIGPTALEVETGARRPAAEDSGLGRDETASGIDRDHPAVVAVRVETAVAELGEDPTVRQVGAASREEFHDAGSVHRDIAVVSTLIAVPSMTEESVGSETIPTVEPNVPSGGHLDVSLVADVKAVPLSASKPPFPSCE